MEVFERLFSDTRHVTCRTTIVLRFFLTHANTYTCSHLIKNQWQQIIDRKENTTFFNKKAQKIKSAFKLQIIVKIGY